jgi:hypothetical protein
MPEELQDRVQLRAKVEEAVKELQEREEDHLNEGNRNRFLSVNPDKP